MASSNAILSSFLIFITAIFKVALPVTVTTPEQVNIPLGRTGEIPCNFYPPSYAAIYWTRRDDADGKEHVISRVGEDVTGSGFDSGNFNLTEDNALQIRYMQLKDEGRYECQVLDTNYEDDASETQVIAIVTPETAPRITWSCGDQCISQHGPSSILNLTCTSDEAKPPVKLIWTNDQGTPIEAVSSSTPNGTMLVGSSVTTSTIQYVVKRNNTLTCQAESEMIGKRSSEQRSTVKLYESVTPDEAPSVTTTCVNHCRTGIDVGTLLNLTCTSGEARPPIKLKWKNSHGSPIVTISSDVQVGSTVGTFVTTAVIQYTFKSNTTLTCQAAGLTGQMTIVQLNEMGIGTSAHRENLNGSEIDEGGFDLVTILLVAVAVAVGVVIILGIAVAVLYKKNKEYPVFQSPMFYLTNGRATVSSQEVASPTTEQNLRITFEVTVTNPTSYDSETASETDSSTLAA